jgi:Predicted ATPase
VKYSTKFINFTNYAKFIFSTNKIPETLDDSDAFFRRWILINFPNKFEGNTDDALLGKKITTAEELSGIFNWALVGAKRLLARGGFEHRETEKVRNGYQRMASPLYAFVKDCLEVDPEGWISKEGFYNSFVEYCKAENFPVIAKSVVGKRLPEHIHVESQYKRVGGGGARVRVWQGIKYKIDTESRIKGKLGRLMNFLLKRRRKMKNEKNNNIKIARPSSMLCQSRKVIRREGK